MRHPFLALTLLLFAASCGGKAVDSTTGGTTKPITVPATGQHVLFELSYVNFAWGLSINGAYVTDKGEVYQYDYVEDTGGNAGEPYLELVPGMTEAQVTQKHGPSPKLLTTVDPDTLKQKFGLVGGARSGALLSEYGCADYGEQRYVAYLYDDTKHLYTPVMLGTDGDLAVRNTAPEGELLLEWIRSLVGYAGDRMCQLSASACYGEMCPGTQPCDAGEVPMYPSDQDGCMTYCGSVSRCESVPSCSACEADGSACVVDDSGVAHCVSWVPGCQETASCGCGGDALCAGGASYCKGTAASGFSCSPP